MSQWWHDHHNLALTARFMAAQGSDLTQIIYMIEKPHRHTDEYLKATVEEWAAADQ